MKNKNIYIITGGTVNYVTAHFALSAPAYGKVGEQLYDIIDSIDPNAKRFLVKTRMAGKNNRHTSIELNRLGISKLETNDDMSRLVDALVADENTGCIIMAAAICDLCPDILANENTRQVSDFGKKSRPSFSEGRTTIVTKPSAKIINKIRKNRKDIFLVSFKDGGSCSSEKLYPVALASLKKSSSNLVFANSRFGFNFGSQGVNMIVTPEESNYSGKTRQESLEMLAKMTIARMGGTFTRSTVVEGETVNWRGREVPQSLRTIVDHCINRGAYKEFLGKTVGHFAFKCKDGSIVTSKRGTNFNNLDDVGMVRIVAEDDDSVIAYGAKPSVGGQSQRAIFRDHPECQCIVHFHCPMKPMSEVNVRSQFEFECGSHECGQNTSSGLTIVNGSRIKVVMLDNHGPNLVFPSNINPKEVIDYIESNFDLEDKTGGLLANVS